MFRTLALAVAALCLSTSLALADDWSVTKLRGRVLQLVDGQWEPLERGDVVSDDRVLRTLMNGRAELQRGKEIITLGPDTQIQIHDRDGKLFTTVQEYFGTVEVDAEARNVQHFAVQTPFLAAVVKGTHFTVVTTKRGSDVEVARGHVAVRSSSTGVRTVLSVGQEAKVGVDGTMSVDGDGTLPAIVDKSGNVVSASAAASNSASTMAPGKTGSAAGGLKVGQDGTPPGLTIRTEVGNAENGGGGGNSHGNEASNNKGNSSEHAQGH